jgi:tetratricopeptide (TPR) repeat protein
MRMLAKFDMHTSKCPVPRVLTIILATAIMTGCSREAKTTRLAESAESYLKAGELDKAKIEYISILRKEPQNAVAIRQLGLIWSEQGAPLRAVPFLLRTREQAPNNLEARKKLTAAFVYLGQMSEARKEAITILEQQPASEDAIIFLAETSRTADDIADTEQQFRKFPQPDSAAFHLASGKLFLAKADLASAEKALQQALTLNPKSEAAHQTLSDLYLRQKKTAEADQELKMAVELAPVRSVTRLRYVQLKMQNGAPEEAKAILKEMTRQARDYMPAWCSLAQIALSEKKYDEAAALLESVLARDPEYFDARILQNEIWLAKGEFKKAVEGCERLNTTYPDVPVVKYQLARAYVQDNNTNKASMVLNQVVTQSPDYEDAVLLLGEINLRAGDAPPVVTAMTALLKKTPSATRAQLLLAEACRRLGRFDEAAAVYRGQIKADPKNASSQYLLGATLRQQGKTAEARQAFAAAQELAPENLQPTDQLVELDIQDKDFTGALQRVQRLTEKSPKSAGAKYLEGKLYAAERQWAKAKEALQQALDLDPELAGAYDLLGSVYIASQQLPQAISVLDGILAKSPGNVRALMLQALIYDKTKDFTKARDAYEKVLAAKPDSLSAMNNLAYLYADRLNQPDKALELARNARELQPTDAIVADTLGWILYQRADYVQALALFQESTGKFPDRPEFQLHLGLANYMMGRTEAARTAFRQVEQAPPDFPGKEDARRRLALLGNEAGQSVLLSSDDLEAIIKQQPDDVIARLRLAESYEKQGQLPKAAATYEQALKLNPKLLAAATKLAQLNGGPLQNRDKAMEYAKKARDIAPADPQVAAILGRIAYQAGDFSWAQSLLQESARKLGNDAGVLRDFAWAAYSLGKVTDAQQTMQRALDASPDPTQAADAKLFLTMVSLDQNPPDLLAAEGQVQKALEADSKYVPALMAHAAIQMQRRESKAATDTYLEVLRRLPDFAPAQKRLASLYADVPESRAKAYELAVKARKTLPEDLELALTLAEINYQKKNYTGALQLLRESARKKPLDAKSQFYLGMCYREAKNKSQSKEALQRALSSGLQEPFLTEAKQAVAELDKK